MTKKTVTVQELLDDMPYLEVASGEEYILLRSCKLEVSDLSRPALELTGYFDYYPQDRVQLLGKKQKCHFLIE